jgi:4-hydroxybenzoate polyprenyltransferase
MSRLSAYIRLARLDKPTGYWLLLFPAWWSQLLHSPQGQWPDFYLMLLFFLGAVVMRAAGCVINDVYDRKIDREVARTRSRPVASGEIKVPMALAFAGALTLVGLLIVLQMGTAAFLLAAASLPLILIYQLMKRFTFWPQAFLGLTFNWGALVAGAAMTGVVSFPAVLIYVACFFWTLAYDTIYAFQDVRDDSKAGVKSTARLLGKKARGWVGLWYVLLWIFLVAAGLAAHMGFGFYVGMALTLFEIAVLMRLWKPEDEHNNAELFRANTLLGWFVLFSLIAGLFSTPL